jgi:hypothetical protein
MGPEFRLGLLVRFMNREAAAFAVIAGRVAPIETGYSPKIQPLLVTSLGRSGSTAMMNLLAHINGVAADREYPLEMRVGRYWLHLFTIMANVGNIQLSAGRENFAVDQFRSGRNPFHDAAPTALNAWFDSVHVTNAARFIQEQIDGAYAVVAAEQGAGEPRYFAEKSNPDRYAALFPRLYGGAREIILVRDVRDLYCSITAFNAKRGHFAFGREDAASEADYLRQLTGSTRALYEAWQARRSTALLVRYEDLMTDQEGTVSRICDYLGLPQEDNDPAEVVRRMEADGEYLGEHRTTPTIASSIGRWRRDMPPELLAEVAAETDEVLVGFGYETSA